MQKAPRSISQPIVRLLIYGTLLLAVSAVGAGGMGLGYQLGQEDGSSVAVRAYYQGGYDQCMGVLVNVFKQDIGTVQGFCLGYAGGMHKGGWHLLPPATGWSWEFVSGEK